MKRLACLGLVMIWSFASCVASAGEAEDAIFNAMRDELARNMSQLEIEGSGRPYFISYTVDDMQTLHIKASLGTLTKSELERMRFVTVDLRVGDRGLDNANFSPGYSMPGPDYSRIAVDSDYDAIRNEIYLLTDKAYKDALKIIARKEAYLETRLIKDRPEDLIEQQVHRVISRPEDFDIDQAYFEDLARAASGVLRDYPMIIFSQLRLTGAVLNQYFLSSSGTSALRGDRIYIIKIAMSGRGADGDDVFCDDGIIVTDLEDLPGPDGLVQWVRTTADEMAATMTAETIEEYAGPVILVDDAAGEFFQQIFAKSISGIPAPLFEKENMADFYPIPHLAERVGRRVLPPFIDVYDDPAIDHLRGLRLIGTYEIDDAGGIPERIQIVEDGKLVGLPIGTAPAKKLREPNGHARGAVGGTVYGRPANLVIESSEGVSLEELKETMLEICRDYDLEYGLIIGKLADRDAPYDERPFSYGGSPGNIYLSDPVRAYRVFPDGREEPVRRLEFSNMTLRVLRDIIKTGNKHYVHNYLIEGDYEMPASIVCPAVLIEEMELNERDVKPRKPPILPSPLLEQE